MISPLQTLVNDHVAAIQSRSFFQEFIKMETMLCPKCGDTNKVTGEVAAECGGCQLSARLGFSKANAPTSNLTKPEDAEMEDFIKDWRVKCEEAAFMLIELIVLSGRQRSTSAALELLRSIPHTMNELNNLGPDSLLYRYCIAARGQPLPRLTKVIDVIEGIIVLTVQERKLLDASLAGVFVGWGTGG